MRLQDVILMDSDVLGVVAQFQYVGAVRPVVVAERLELSVQWARFVMNRLVARGKLYRAGDRLGYVLAELPLDDEILKGVEVQQRRIQGGVLAWHVQPLLSLYRGEGQIRRDMYRLWCAGKLVRIGGADARRGYMVVRSDTVVLDVVRLVQREVDVITVKDVVKHLPDDRSERTVRRELVRLVESGKLVRIGARRGYAVAG